MKNMERKCSCGELAIHINTPFNEQSGDAYWHICIHKLGAYEMILCKKCLYSLIKEIDPCNKGIFKKHYNKSGYSIIKDQMYFTIFRMKNKEPLIAKISDVENFIEYLKSL